MHLANKTPESVLLFKTVTHEPNLTTVVVIIVELGV